MSKVVIRKCEEYDLDKIESILTESIKSLSINNNIESIIKPNCNVFIKLNCVGSYNPNLGITSHPVFTEAIIKIVKKYTNNIIIGDNPATRDINAVLKKIGIYELVDKYNLKIINQNDRMTIKNSNYKVYNSFEVSREIIESDLIINTPKLKTHSLAYMTCAEKNFFGTIFGLEKAGWHAKASNPLEFGNAINDLYGAILENHQGEILNICDGIIGLEGEGPGTSGITKPGNVILSSLDAISLDKVACDIVKLKQEKLFITNIAFERQFSNKDLIEIDGNIKEFEDLYFLPPKDAMSNVGLNIIQHKFFRNLLLEHPKIDHTKCIRCGECAKICPPQTMKLNKEKKNSFPNMTKCNCIRCWCCQEVCPQNAISKSNRPIIGKIVFKIKL